MSNVNFSAAVVLGLLATKATADTAASIFNGQDCEGVEGPSIRLEYLNSYRQNIFDESAAEALDFDKETKHVFFVNANAAQVQTLDTTGLTAESTFDIVTLPTPSTHTPNSVSVSNGLVAVALALESKFMDGTAEVKEQLPGAVGFYMMKDGMWQEVGLVNFNEPEVQTAMLGDSGMPFGYAGALPDMVKFTPDGKKAVVAIEGEGAYVEDETEDIEEYSKTRRNPEGSVVVIDIGGDAETGFTFTPTNVDFRGLGLTSAMDCEKCAGSTANFMTDMYADGQKFGAHIDAEPEFVAISDDSMTAYVAMQENNAVAVIDLMSKTVTKVIGLGYKEAATNALDIGDNGVIEIEKYPAFKTMYQPDSIVFKMIGDKSYFITANEGDDRDGETTKAHKIADNFSDSLKAALGDELVARLADKDDLGDIMVHASIGIDADGMHNELVGYGGRSFSMWDAETGMLVYDSGSEFEEAVAKAIMMGDLPEAAHNADKDGAELDARSDKKGVETEAVDVATINGHTYVVAGLETNSGLAVYDVTDPMNASMLQYLARRHFLEDGEEDMEAGSDMGPEYVKFVSAEDSPVENTPLVLVSNEISGSITMWKVNVCEGDMPMMGGAMPPMYGGMDMDMMPAAMPMGDDVEDMDKGMDMDMDMAQQDADVPAESEGAPAPVETASGAAGIATGIVAAVAGLLALVA